MTFKATQAQGTPENFKLTGDLTIKNTTCRWSAYATKAVIEQAKGRSCAAFGSGAMTRLAFSLSVARGPIPSSGPWQRN